MYGTMSRLLLAAFLVTATASVASAGTVIGVGVGTNIANTGTGLEAGGRSGRLEVGYKFGRLSVEGIGGRASLGGGDWTVGDATWTTVGLAGKYSLSLGSNFEAFGRLGLQHTSIDVSNDPKYGGYSYSGGGIFGGGGFEYHLASAVTGLSFFVDYTIAHSSLSNDGGQFNDTYGFTARYWTLGVNLAL